MVLSRAFISGKRREMQQEFMGRAIALSRTHMRAGGDGPFGAVIVKGGDIIAEGYNAVISSKDPTAHAADFQNSGAIFFQNSVPLPET